jgi:nucleoside-diphosphate-sugar epimerase
MCIWLLYYQQLPKNPAFAWDLNMNSLFHVLNLAKAGKIKKIFWPSIAVFGLPNPKSTTIHHHGAVYGMESVNKQAKDGASTTNIFGVDVRSIRYPGLISWSSPPGGGTTGMLWILQSTSR